MRKFDNIDLDMIEAEKLGYGVQYGRFKADHPFTKEKNEPYLSGKKKIKIKKVYPMICCVCGMHFTTTNKSQIHCSKKCKSLHRSNKWSRSTTK